MTVSPRANGAQLQAGGPSWHSTLPADFDQLGLPGPFEGYGRASHASGIAVAGDCLFASNRGRAQRSLAS